MSDNFFLKDSERNLIINLEVLGSLDYKTKLYVRGKNFIHCPVNIYNTVQRSLLNEDRTITQLKIKNLVTALHETICPISVDKKDLYNYIYPIILKAKEGILKLKGTYENDKTYVAELEIDVKNLAEIIKSITPYIEIHSEVKTPDFKPIDVKSLTDDDI